ncbi:MAG: hypothetical protein ACTSUH_02010, partial [Candidatus Thorarchaeota archaeon]
IVVVLVEFRDTDLSEGITNTTGNVNIQVSSPTATQLTWSVAASSLGTGHYNVTFDADQWGTIGWKDLIITVRWVGPVDKYYNQTIQTSVRILGTDTDLYLEQAPTAKYYLEEVTFTAVYWDAVNGTKISNATYAYVHVRVTPITAGHPVTQQDFSIFELTSDPGTYEFRLNTSAFGITGSFQFQIDFMWAAGQAPLYENKTMTVTIVVLERPTYVDYAPVASTPYGETATLTFNYIDTLSAEKIANSSSLVVTLTEGYVVFSLAYDDPQNLFTMTIDTTSLGSTGTFTLHLNLNWTGEPYYSDVSGQAFTLTVVLRNTQLAHLSFAPPQWGNNVTIEFVYTDLVSGSTTGMTGTLTLDSWLAGYYTVTYIPEGHFVVEIDTSGFPSDGVFTLNATVTYTGSNYAADASDIFNIAVNKRSTQLGYDSPDPTPYQENMSLIVTYSDDTTGNPIDGATVSVSCANSSVTIGAGDYWVTGLGNGQYLIEIDSTALGSVATFILNVTVTWTGQPYYQQASKDVTARVVNRPTQIIVTQTPGDTPFLENVTFRFKFSDFLTGQLIAITKADITLSHGTGHTIITTSQYALHATSTYYEISFSSTVLNPSNLVSNEEIQLTIDRSASVPYYASRDTTVLAKTVERPTQILFPLVQATPYTDNISIVVEYIDYLTKTGISGATVTLTIEGLPSATYYVTDRLTGSYEILVPTEQFGSTGTITFNLTISKSGTPFYASRIASDVNAVIRPIQTSVIASAPSPASVPVGEDHVVNITVYDTDHNVPLTGATISTDWTSLYGTSATIVEVGNGVYRLVINTTGLVAQPFSFTVWAEKTNYRNASASVTIQPGALTVDIVPAKTTYYADWGERVLISVNIVEPYHGTLVPNMTVRLLWNGTLYNFTDWSNGTYSLWLDTSVQDYGVYEPLITVSREFYQPRSKSITLVVSKATGEIVPEMSTIEVVPSEYVQFWVYLNDTVRNLPVAGANVTLTWNDTTYMMAPGTAAGYYLGALNFTGFAIGQYQASVRAVAPNFVFLEIEIEVVVSPLPTAIRLNEGAISLSAYRGDPVTIVVEYNNTFDSSRILGASVTYEVGGLSGTLTEQPDGTYTATIDTSALGVGSLDLRITAAKSGYATSRVTVVLDIMPIPTQLTIDSQLLSGYYGDTLTFTFYYNDTHSNQPIADADVMVTWDGGASVVVDHHNGTYSVSLLLNVTVPRTYKVSVSFSKPAYQSAFAEANLAMARTPAAITGVSSLSVPVNETSQLVFTVLNQITGQVVTGLNGYAYWETLGSAPLSVMANGSYVLTVPDDLPIDTYRVEIVISGLYYQVAPKTVEISVRPIRTEFVVATQQISTSPGATIEIEVQYWDLDHNVGINDAELTVALGSGNLTYHPDYTRNTGNGTYVILITVNEAGNFQLSVTLSKKFYSTQQVQFVIQSNPSEAQRFTQNLITGGSISLVVLAVLLFLYVKVLSVPQMIRWINAMLRALRRGRIPRAPPVHSRQEMILDIVNDNLEPVGLRKELEDIDGYPIKAVIPEIDELLARLAEITGLGDEEIEAFKADLARMKVSERPGFLREVIAQEEARRAEALAEAEGRPEKVEPEKPVLEKMPEELEELRRKLQQKGMTPDEIEIIIEQAKALSKADLEALLNSLGIRLD